MRVRRVKLLQRVLDLHKATAQTKHITAFNCKNNACHPGANVSMQALQKQTKQHAPGTAEFSKALRIEYGVHALPCAFSALNSSAMLPHAFGLDIEVPFINWREAKLHVGIGPMAPPAETKTKHKTTMT